MDNGVMSFVDHYGSRNNVVHGVIWFTGHSGSRGNMVHVVIWFTLIISHWGDRQHGAMQSMG